MSCTTIDGCCCAKNSQCVRICNANYCLFDGCPMHPTAHVHNLAGHYTRSCIYFHYHTDLHANAVLPCAVGKSMCPQIQVVLHGVSRRALQEVFITACSWGTNVDIAHAIHRLSPNAPQRLSRHNTVAAHIGVQICVVMDVDARSSIVFR